MRNDTPVSSSNRILAASAESAFGGQPSIYRYSDEPERTSVDLLVCQNSPLEGVDSYATIGLSSSVASPAFEKLNMRVELVGACETGIEIFAECISTAAFCVMNTGWEIAPGAMFPNVISFCKASSTLQHLLFVRPFLWDERLLEVEENEMLVIWLQAVPISENEMRFANAKGVVELEALLESRQVNVFDLERPSVL